LIGTDEEKALSELRNRSVGFFITDSKGKAKISDLKAKTYYVCGVRRTGVELEFGTFPWN
jgi:hypothetical protein